MIWFIRQSKLEKVFDKFMLRYKLKRIDLGNHIFLTYRHDENTSVLRYDKGDTDFVIERNFYESIRNFFSFDDNRAKEFLMKWFRRKFGKKIKNILISDFGHKVKVYHGFAN